MIGRPAYASVSRHGRFSVAGLCIAGLSACVVQDAVPRPANLVVDDLALKIYYEPDVFYPGPATAVVGENAIEPFPLTVGMVVARQDGKSLDASEVTRAQEAAEFYCQQQGGSPGMGDRAGLAKDTTVSVWYFGGCSQ